MRAVGEYGFDAALPSFLDHRQINLLVICQQKVVLQRDTQVNEVNALFQPGLFQSLGQIIHAHAVGGL